MTPELKAALEKLDSENDAHWTTDGQVRLDLLKLYGVDISRAELLLAAPGYSRANRDTSVENTDSATHGEPQGEGGVDTAEAPAEGFQFNGDEDFSLDGNGGDLFLTDGEFVAERYVRRVEVNLAELGLSAEQELEVLQLRQADLVKAIDELRKWLDAANKRVDVLDAQLTPNQKTTNAEAIRAYLDRQTVEGRAKAEAEAKRKALVGDDPRSPLDLSMRRRTGFGHNRPKHGYGFGQVQK